MLLVFKFILPYMLFCNLGAWGLAQNLEGLKFFHYINDLPVQMGADVIYPWNISPKHGVYSLTFLLTFILVPISLLNIRAGFYLNKWAGWISLCMWILPGVLSLMGYLPDLHDYGPDKFQFGASFTGSTSSAAVNLAICLVAGWSVIMLFSTFWKISTFKNAYDHIWYVLGLIAALYFVVDSGLPSYKEDLSESGDRTTRILTLYHDGVQNLASLCANPEVSGRAPDLCALVPDIRWGIQNRLEMKDMLRARIDEPDWVARVASDPLLQQQIDALNIWACSSDQIRGNCQTVPIELSLNGTDFKTPVVFLRSGFAQELLNLHKSMQSADERIQEIDRGHNARYFVFLMLAFVAGGKLANASRSMREKDSVRPPSWLLMIIRFILRKSALVLRVLVMAALLPLIRVLFHSGRRLAAWLNARVVRREAKDESSQEQG